MKIERSKKITAPREICYEDIVRFQKKRLELERLKSKGFSYEDIQEMMFINDRAFKFLNSVPIVC
jgi:hypothetical protein